MGIPAYYSDLGILGTFASAFAAFLAARATKKTAQQSFVEQRQAATLSYLQSNRERARNLRYAIGPLQGAIPRLDEETGKDLLNLLEIWEHQAAGLNDGAFDLETFNKMTGGLLLRVYRDYASFIRHIRREDPTIYDQLEVLVDKLIVMRSSGFLIDRKALAGLKQDVLTRAEIARVRKLRSNDEYAFSKLQQALVEIDLDTEKNRITRVTRMKLGRIVALEKSNEGAVVKLFDEIQRATKGKYPPKKLIDSTYGPGIGGIEKWLDRGFESTRFVYILGRNNHVIGHIEIQDLRSISGEDSKKYWERVFSESAEFNNEKKGDRPLRIDDLAIIKRLGVHPDYTRRQIGRQLLRRAIHVIEEELMQVPALVVLEELSPARRLYESEGARLIGAFREETGEQMLSYIF